MGRCRAGLRRASWAGFVRGQLPGSGPWGARWGHAPWAGAGGSRRIRGPAGLSLLWRASRRGLRAPVGDAPAAAQPHPASAASTSPSERDRLCPGPRRRRGGLRQLSVGRRGARGGPPRGGGERAPRRWARHRLAFRPLSAPGACAPAEGRAGPKCFEIGLGRSTRRRRSPHGERDLEHRDQAFASGAAAWAGATRRAHASCSSASAASPRILHEQAAHSWRCETPAGGREGPWPQDGRLLHTSPPSSGITVAAWVAATPTRARRSIAGWPLAGHRRCGWWFLIEAAPFTLEDDARALGYCATSDERTCPPTSHCRPRRGSGFRGSILEQLPG